MFRRLFVFLIDSYLRWTAFLRDRRNTVDALIHRREIEEYERRLLDRDRRIEQLESANSLLTEELKTEIAVNERNNKRIEWETAAFARGIEEAKNNPRFGG